MKYEEAIKTIDWLIEEEAREDVVDALRKSIEAMKRCEKADNEFEGLKMRSDDVGFGFALEITPEAILNAIDRSDEE